MLARCSLSRLSALLARYGLMRSPPGATSITSPSVVSWTYTGSCFDALRKPADVYTIGRDRVAWLHAQFIQDGKQVVEWPWDIVVADEAQTFASQSSQRFEALYDLRTKTRFQRLVELSGTPMPNGYMKLWSQLKLLDNGKRLGYSENAMKQRWFTPPVGIFTKWNIRPTAPAEIQRAVKDIVLVLREEDYLDLPAVVDNFVRCDLSASAMATYKRFERELIAEVAGKKLTAVNAGVLDGKLLQLANGACYHAQKRVGPVPRREARSARGDVRWHPGQSAHLVLVQSRQGAYHWIT